MHAIDKFDVTQQTALSTYAAFWIRQAIQRAMDNESRLIRLPVHAVQQLTALRDSEDESHSLNDLQRAMLAADHPWQSLDEPASTADSDDPLAAIIPASDPSPDDVVIARDHQARITQAFQMLPTRQRRIVMAWLGWPDHEPQTFAAIARQEHLSSQRIQQIVHEGLTRLRQHPDLYALLRSAAQS
nr:sigma-70 family RNA polymerase sigma factor [Sulfobacillus thermosulfidooxidans]